MTRIIISFVYAHVYSPIRRKFTKTDTDKKQKIKISLFMPNFHEFVSRLRRLQSKTSPIWADAVTGKDS